MRASIRPWPNRNRSYGEAHRPARNPPICPAIPREDVHYRSGWRYRHRRKLRQHSPRYRPLASLNIRVVVVHRAAEQIQALAQKQNVEPSNLDGAGVTDAATLQLAIEAASRVMH